MAAIFLAAVLMLTGCGTGAGESSSTGSKETQTTEADGNPGCRMGDRAWTAAYAGSVSAFRMDPSSADKDFSEISEI